MSDRHMVCSRIRYPKIHWFIMVYLYYFSTRIDILGHTLFLGKAKWDTESTKESPLRPTLALNILRPSCRRKHLSCRIIIFQIHGDSTAGSWWKIPLVHDLQWMIWGYPHLWKPGNHAMKTRSDSDVSCALNRHQAFERGNSAAAWAPSDRSLSFFQVDLGGYNPWHGKEYHDWHDLSMG